MVYLADKYIGKHIGKYFVVSKSDKKSSDGHTLYNAMCVWCGFLRRDVRITQLQRGSLAPCKHKSLIRWSNSRLQRTFHGMVDRCYNPNCQDYANYGGKGIRVCVEWLNDHSLFEDWAFNNGYADDLTIDRKDSSLDYCPTNCRWIPRGDNSRWKSTTNMIVVNGVVDSGRGWSRKLGCGINYINRLLRAYGIDYVVKFIKDRLAADKN